MEYNNDRLPNEVLEHVMEYVSFNGPYGTCFNVAALLTCRKWAAVGLPVLYRDTVHRQNRNDTERTQQLTNVLARSGVSRDYIRSLTLFFGNAGPEKYRFHFTTI